MMHKDYINGAFGALPEEFARYATAKIAVLPIPYDGTSTWLKGADQGPTALLTASANMELYDIETDSEVYRQGIVTLPSVTCPQEPEQMVDAVAQQVKQLLADGKFVVGIGGEHSITIGMVQAMRQYYPQLSVLQFDAHADLRPIYEQSPFNHACVMARVRELCPIMQVGIRSMDSSELSHLDRDRVIFAHEFPLDQQGITKILHNLSHQVYVTIDLDVFDPAYMPATGTPEPGGLDWYSVLSILREVIKHRQVVGFDVNELLPHPENKAPDFLAAKLVYRFLSMIFIKEAIHAQE